MVPSNNTSPNETEADAIHDPFTCQYRKQQLKPKISPGILLEKDQKKAASNSKKKKKVKKKKKRPATEHDIGAFPDSVAPGPGVGR